jgi:aminoglycoside phosphotransferase family enzyme/predicted kinase
MQLADLIQALSNPRSYPQPVEDVTVCQTHISVVFLAGHFAYKIKKPVRLGFLDFGSLEKRKYFCEQEVELNRRVAPSVYLGVVPVMARADGVWMDPKSPEGTILEWAVKMVRLPEEATLLARLHRGEVGKGELEVLARTLASFHRQARGGEHIARFGDFNTVAGNVRENFQQAAGQEGITVSRAVLDRLRTRAEEELARQQGRIEERARSGVPRDTHGDLHLDHVYLFPGDELLIVDCIEFNERFRYADPVADMAFLVMDLRYHGWGDLADDFADAYFQASGDGDGRALLPLYTSYRAAVRAKVEGFEVGESEVPEEERQAALARSRAHWLLALTELERPKQRPCLVLVAGLPGVGKSTLSRGLAREASFALIRADEVRKELAGLSPDCGLRIADCGLSLKLQSAIRNPQSGAGSIYTPEWNERTYQACLTRAEKLLFEGRRVLVDATFRRERWRSMFLDLARKWAIPGLMLLCQADSQTIRTRLDRRKGDVSDADWATYQELARQWEKPGPATRSALVEVDTSRKAEEVLAQVRSYLGERGLDVPIRTSMCG